MSVDIEKYTEYCNAATKYMTSVEKFLLPPQTSHNNSNFYIAGIADNLGKYETIEAPVPINLIMVSELVCRAQLTRIFSAYGDMQVSLFPSEEIESVSLLLDEQVVETIHNVGTGTFRFSRFPYLFHISGSKCIVEVRFRKVRTMHNDPQRILWVNSVYAFSDTYEKLNRIMWKFYYGEDILIEDTEEQKAVKQTLKEMQFCPTCREKAVTVCMCTKRDSECGNGHRWYYNEVNNRIIVGACSH